jgi:hypothetical protein
MVKTPSDQFLYGILHVASVAHCILGGSPPRGIFDSVLGALLEVNFGAFLPAFPRPEDGSGPVWAAFAEYLCARFMVDLVGIFE